MPRSGSPIDSERMPGAPARPPAAVAMGRQLDRCESDGTGVFFFGSEPETVHRLRDVVASAWPRLRIAGICDADFKGAASAAIVDFIAGTKPGLILLDMGEREARAFMQANGRRFPQASIVHVGGAFAAFVMRHGERALWPAGGLRPGAGLWRGLRQALSAARFTGIVTAQLLQGGMSRARLARPGAAMRRD